MTKQETITETLRILKSIEPGCNRGDIWQGIGEAIATLEFGETMPITEVDWRWPKV